MVAVPTTGKVAKPERVLPHSVLSLRQKLGRKAKQEPKFRFYTRNNFLCAICADGVDLFVIKLGS